MLELGQTFVALDESVIVGSVHVVVPTVRYPVVRAKNILLVLAATELVLPHVPEAVPAPFNVRVLTGIFKPAPILADTPDPIDKSPVTEVPVDMDFAPLPEKTNFE